MCPKRDDCGQEGIHMSKKGQFQGKKWSAHPKMGQHGAGRGWHVQKRGRQGFVCPKRDDSGRERVSAAKNRAGSGSCVQKRTIPGEKGLARPKMGQEGVRVSKMEQGEVGASQNGAESGRRVQKRGRKRSVHPKR